MIILMVGFVESVVLVVYQQPSVVAPIVESMVAPFEVVGLLVGSIG